MPTDLPFAKEEGWDYILDEAGRQKFAPQLGSDEYWSVTLTSWREVTNPGEFTQHSYYRRRKSSGWVSVKERLPEDGRDVLWVSNGKVYFGPLTNGGPIWTSITHWFELPALPQPPKPAAEVAFEDYWHKETAKAMGYLKDAEAKAVWLAAIEWAKAHKGEI